MKRLMVLTLTLVLIAAMAVTTATAQEIHIPDAELAKAIREALGLGEGARITAAAMRNLTELAREPDEDPWGIVDLTGLEHAVNLEWLSLSNNNDVSDISPLAGLTNLKWLDLWFTDVSDISVLAGLTNLETLDLSATDVSDISPLASLTNLEGLLLSNNHDVSDISVLAGLTNLEVLTLGNTKVSDISPLASLTNLKWLWLHYTDVSDISVLAGLTNLEELRLDNTGVSDISALVNLPNLEELNLLDCPLSPASRTHAFALQAKGVDVSLSNVIAQQPVQVQQPTWEFQRSFRPHPDTFGATKYIEDIGFYGNSQVFFARSSRLYKWDMSTGRYWWITHNTLFANSVRHVEVSESHDIFAYNAGAQLKLRRASDLEFIASVGLPGSPKVMAMEPGTNYLIVSGEKSGLGDLSSGNFERTYDLWENNSWGLNLVTDLDYSVSSSIDILDRDYAYTVRPERSSYVSERYPRSLNAYPGGVFWLKDNNRSIHDKRPVGVAAGKTSIGVRIAAITSRDELVVWDWFGNRLYTHQFNSLNPRSFQFTPNREILTWINDSKITFWDVTTQKVDAVVERGETGSFRCHAFSKDGKTMAVGDNNGTVHIYKWTGGSALAAPAKETELSPPTALLSNYPNPFNPETWIPYQLSDPAEVTVSIYSVNGKLVRTLELGQMPAGVYSDKGRAAYWNGQNEQGEPVASGVYFYTLTAGEFKATRKMVIRK